MTNELKFMDAHSDMTMTFDRTCPDQYIRHLEQIVEHGKWHDAEVEKPEPNRIVLAWVPEDKGIYAAQYRTTINWKFKKVWCFYGIQKKVSHWAYLPYPPTL